MHGAHLESDALVVRGETKQGTHLAACRPGAVQKATEREETLPQLLSANFHTRVQVWTHPHPTHPPEPNSLLFVTLQTPQDMYIVSHVC